MFVSAVKTDLIKKMLCPWITEQNYVAFNAIRVKYLPYNNITKDSVRWKCCGIREADLVEIYVRYMCNDYF